MRCLEYWSCLLLRISFILFLDPLWSSPMGRNSRYAIFQNGLAKTYRIQQDGQHIVQDEELDFKDADI